MTIRLKPAGWATAALLLAASAVHALVPTGPGAYITPTMTFTKVAPRISWNGARVTFTDYTGNSITPKTVYDNIVMNSDGTDISTLVWSGYTVQDEWGWWSPDGSRLAFQAWNGKSGTTAIWVYDFNTTTATKFVDSPRYDAYPTWSPDGSKIGFMSQRNSAGIYNLFVINADKPENDTDNKAVQLTSYTTGGGMGRPSFSPDGKQIIYTGKTAAMPRNDLFLMDVVDVDNDGWGDNMRALTDAATVIPGANPASVSEPYIIGDRYYFVALSSNTVDGKYHVYSAALDGVNKDVWQVTASDADEAYMSASPTRMVVLGRWSPSQGADVQGVYAYDMTDADDTPGSVSGTLPVTPQGSAAGYLVEILNGGARIAETTTDVNGAWALTDLRPGGYFLRFSSPTGHPLAISTVTRPVIVAPGKNAEVSVFSSPRAARRPRNVIPTIRDDGSVNIRFQPDPESQLTAGWRYATFNVYRGHSENGPWTYIGSVSTDAPLFEFIDNNPGNLTEAFYTATTVTTDGSATLESWYADAGQAANNLVFNPSFEMVDASNLPIGFSFRQDAGGDATWASTTDAIVGTRSVVVTQGSAPIGTYVETTVEHSIPTPPGGVGHYVQGAYTRIINTPAASSSVIRLAYSVTKPNAGALAWYGTGYNSSANASSAAVPTTPLVWVGYTNPIATFTPSTYTRISLVQDKPAAGFVPGDSRVVYDELRFQARRVGETGVVWGRVFDAAGSPVAGVTVSDGEKTARTDARGLFDIGNSTTGAHTVTFSYPGQPNIVRQIKNVGGYVFSENLAFPNVIPLSFGGRVLLSNGLPAKGATVTWVVGNLLSDGSQDVYSATTDASGYYTLDTSSRPLDTTKKVWVSAHLAGYKSAYLLDRSIAGSAGTVGFDLTLGARTPVIEIGRATVPPTIDGVVNAGEWANSAEITGFMAFPTTNPYSPGTRAYAMWDSENLYVAMVADEPNPAGIKADQMGHEPFDSPGVWGDDNFQVFLDPLVSLGLGFGRDVWQFGFNLNTMEIGVTDGIIRIAPNAVALNTSATVFMQPANSVDAAGKKWTVEAAIPWDGLSYDMLMVQAPSVGVEWGGMFARTRTQDASNASTSSLGARFAEPWNWNTLRFVNTVSPPTISALDALKIASGLRAATSLAGDTDNSGTITLEDAVALLRAENGLN